MAHPTVNHGINKVLAIASLSFFLNMILLLFLLELFQGCATAEQRNEPPAVKYAE